MLKITSDGTQAAPALKFNDTNTGFYKSGDSVRFSLNNSTKWTIDATGVGIGTDAPSEKLDIEDNQNAGTKSTVNNSDSGTGAFTQISGHAFNSEMFMYAIGGGFTTSGRFVAATGLIDATGIGGLGLSAGNAPINFWTNNTKKMTILADGKVGIGTTSPDNPLHSFNETQITSNDIIQYPLKIEAKDTSGDFWFRQGVGIQFENTASSGDFISAEIIGRNTINAGTRGELLFNTRVDDALSTKMIIKDNGDVGIGTSSPGSKLDVEMDIDTTYSTAAIPGGGVIIHNNADGNVNDMFSSLFFHTTPQGAVNSIGAISLINPDKTAHGAEFAFQLRADAGTYSEIMRMKANGNVGIGTVSPDKKLHVAGTESVALFQDADTSHYTSIMLGETTTTNAALTWYGSAYGTASLRERLDVSTGGDLYLNSISGDVVDNITQ